MNYAIIKDGIVSNIAVSEAPLADNWIPAPAGISKGWLYDGQDFSAPPPPPPVVPQEVTRRQAKQALLLAGLLDNVQPAIDAIEDATQRGLVQIEWDDSQVFQRDRPALIGLGTALGLDSDGLDQLFIQAGALE